jgi:hypothetical protein
MIPIRSKAPGLLALLALLGTVTGATAQSALAQTRAHHQTRHHHHIAKTRKHHQGTGIGPGGDQDSDNHGAPSDGDGNL